MRDPSGDHFTISKLSSESLVSFVSSPPVGINHVDAPLAGVHRSLDKRDLARRGRRRAEDGSSDGKFIDPCSLGKAIIFRCDDTHVNARERV